MIIIIGTGLAGYQLAREFRKLDTHTPLMLVTQDAGHYYPKPQLSTALTQKKTSETIATANAESMAKQLNATILTHAQVTKINPEEKTIEINSEYFSYDQLVLACGADIIKPPLQGDAVNDVLSINHLYHYAEFEKLIQNKKVITILGAGLIGCEFANDLSNAGYKVNIIAPDKTPLERFIPSQVGLILQKALEKNGVTFYLSRVAEEINKNNSHYQLSLSDGSVIESDFILSAIGLRPHTELAKTADIAVNRGILVNRLLQTSQPSIYALGDCAEVEGHVLPFITPILNCARALAKTLAGTPTAVDYPAMPVTVKTPAHPIVVCPPPLTLAGQWQIQASDENVRALFYDNDNKLQGFVLTNQAVKERLSLAQQIPNLF